MRKKLTALLLTGAVAASGVLGLTACGPDSGDPPPAETLERGEQVTEAQWKAAISATVNAKNFTATQYQKDVYSFTPPESASVSPYSETAELSAKAYADLENNKLYCEMTQSSCENGGTPVQFTVKSYAEIDGTTVYSSVLSPETEGWKADFEEYEEDELSEVLGEALLTYCLTDEVLSKSEGGALKSVYDLYSAFTYHDGIYTAAMYTSEYYEQTTVSVSVKSGYVAGMKLEMTDADEEEGFSLESVYVFTFGGFSATDLESIVPEGAAKAIETVKPADGSDDVGSDDVGNVDKDTASGNIYEFDHIYFLTDMDTPEEIEKELLETVPKLESFYEGAVIAYKTDGVVISEEPAMHNTTVATYTQTGNKITMTDYDEESGKTYVLTSTLENGEVTTSVEYPLDGTDITVTIVLVYKYKNNQADAYTAGSASGGGSSEDSDSDYGDNLSVDGCMFSYAGYDVQKYVSKEEENALDNFFASSFIYFEDGTAQWRFSADSEFVHPYTQSNYQIDLSAFTDIPSPYRVDDALLIDSRLDTTMFILDITIIIGDDGLVTVHYLLK